MQCWGEHTRLAVAGLAVLKFGQRHMERAMRSRVYLLLLSAILASAAATVAVEGAALERGLAITDPLILRELDLRERTVGVRTREET